MLAIVAGIGLAIGAIIFALSLGQAVNEAVSAFVDTINTLMLGVFKWFILITPLIIVITPIYILRTKNTKVIIFGSVYGVVLMLMFKYLGMIDVIYSYFLSASWIASWTPNVLDILTFCLTVFNTGIILATTDMKFVQAFWKRKLRQAHKHTKKASRIAVRQLKKLKKVISKWAKRRKQ